MSRWLSDAFLGIEWDAIGEWDDLDDWGETDPDPVPPGDQRTIVITTQPDGTRRSRVTQPDGRTIVVVVPPEGVPFTGPWVTIDGVPPFPTPPGYVPEPDRRSGNGRPPRHPLPPDDCWKQRPRVTLPPPRSITGDGRGRVL